MKPIFICCVIVLALLSCSCGKSPEPPKNDTSQIYQLPADYYTLLVDEYAYSGTEYVKLTGVETKTDYTNWFTWKHYDGKKENAEKAVYIWNGEEVGRGTAGFGEILKRIEAMQKPAKHKPGLSVFCPEFQPLYDSDIEILAEKTVQYFYGTDLSESKSQDKEVISSFYLPIEAPIERLDNGFNAIVKKYSRASDIYIDNRMEIYSDIYETGRCMPVIIEPDYYHSYSTCEYRRDFKKYFPFDAGRLESVLKKKMHVAYVQYAKYVAFSDWRGPAPAKPEKTSPGKTE